jgi:predicted NUDIX family NTP pyrophosphohydrolase
MLVIIMHPRSAGLIMYRWQVQELEIFLVHPGGPFWSKKDKGAWTVPKGEYSEGEQPLEAAKREFEEETGFASHAPFLELGIIKQAGGKTVVAWAFEGNGDPAKLSSNLCRVEWPPHSGRVVEFPEADQGRWFSIPTAREYILKSQEPLLDVLQQALWSLRSTLRQVTHS